MAALHSGMDNLTMRSDAVKSERPNQRLVLILPCSPAQIERLGGNLWQNP